MVSLDMSQNQNGIKSGFSSQFFFNRIGSQAHLDGCAAERRVRLHCRGRRPRGLGAHGAALGGRVEASTRDRDGHGVSEQSLCAHLGRHPQALSGTGQTECFCAIY